MALIKDIDSPAKNGLVLQYWKIGEVRFDYRNQVIQAILHGYKDKEFSETAANNPGASLPITLSGSDWATDKTLASIYTYIKTTPAFTGAIDD